MEGIEPVYQNEKIEVVDEDGVLQIRLKGDPQTYIIVYPYDEELSLAVEAAAGCVMIAGVNGISPLIQVIRRNHVA